MHLIAASENLSKEIGDFKSYTARRIIDRLRETGSSSTLELLQRFKLPHKTDREHQFWQEGSHPQMIADEAMMWQKLEYIHNNPVRRGYVDDPVHWRYSSARNYSKLSALRIGDRRLDVVICHWDERSYPITAERSESPRVATSITSCSVQRETGRASQRAPRDMTAIRSQIPNSSGR